MATRARTSVVPLHVVTNDDVVARSDFMANTTSIMQACGARVAVHLRLKRSNAKAVHEYAGRLASVAAASGAVLIVNERFDIAMSVGASGVQLGRGSVPVTAACAARIEWLWRSRANGSGAAESAAESAAERATERAGNPFLIGYSAHSAAEAAQAAEDGADFIVLGTIWPSSTHPGECTAGVSMISETASMVSCPVIAIGGVTPSRSKEALLAGARGVAVITGVWNAAQPVAAAIEYLNAMQAIR